LKVSCESFVIVVEYGEKIESNEVGIEMGEKLVHQSREGAGVEGRPFASRTSQQAKYERVMSSYCVEIVKKK